jgi:uncharacterized protein
MAKTILITGGSGLIGRSLTSNLLQKGYTIYHLSRAGSIKAPEVRTFHWDVYEQQIDENCIEGVDAIIHLAGEGIAEKPWTQKRKHQIIVSRRESIRLIYDLLKRKEHRVRQVISSSAVGFYGDREDKILSEESEAGTDFLSRACLQWENAVDEGKALGLRVIKLRTGVVLSVEGGALPPLAQPVKKGIGTILGSGKQWVPWIHLEDVVRMYRFALENEQLEGVYNMTAPAPVTNAQLTRQLAKQLNKPLWLPKVPALVLRIILGEMCAVVLSSYRTSADKIKSAGFDFKFSSLEEALNDIYSSKNAD